MDCPNQQKNAKFCTCTYAGCPRHGLCCECVSHHRRQEQLPACFFSITAEASYDRSFDKFVADKGK